MNIAKKISPPFYFTQFSHFPFIFWATPDSAQGIRLTLCSSAQETVVSGLKTGPLTCTQSLVLTFWPSCLIFACIIYHFEYSLFSSSLDPFSIQTSFIIIYVSLIYLAWFSMACMAHSLPLVLDSLILLSFFKFLQGIRRQKFYVCFHIFNRTVNAWKSL